MPLLRLQTPRLELVAATAPLLQADLEGPSSLAKALVAVPSKGWPPPLYERGHTQATLTLLLREPALCGWLAWFWLKKPQRGEPLPTMIGLSGFKGQPGPTGTVEIGYSVVPAFQNQGFATEAVGALIDWAFQHPRVSQVLAETLPELPASIKVLRKCGFEFVGNGSDIEVMRFERKRTIK